MKVLKLILFLLLINNQKIIADTFMGHYIFGFFNIAYSYESYDDSNHHISFGQEVDYFFEPFEKHAFQLGNCFSLNYKFLQKANTINFEYYLLLYSHYSIIHLGLGSNVSYNITKKYFSIGPELNIVTIIIFALKINLTYRYNININKTNSHEIEVKFGIHDFHD